MRGSVRVFSHLAVSVCSCALFAFLAGCSNNNSPTNNPPPAISVALNPTSASLSGSGVQVFAANVANDSSNAGVSWSIGTGAGTLSASSTTGVTYTAPAAFTAGATVTLTATSKTDTTKSTTATITLNPPPISVSVSPATASLSGGGQQTFAATVANDPANAGVTWSIGAGAGTLSASSTTGVTYTAPSTIAATSTVTLTATSITGTSASGTATITLNPPPSSAGIAITGFSTTTPTPLTLLQIETTGISAGSAVTVAFSNSSGFSATEQAARVESDGTVIAGVPLYIDPSTGQFGEGTVSVILTQGTQSSASSSLSIQNLPSVSSYGVQPGQISHAFLVFAAMLHARRLNEFQAAQQLVGSKVSTSVGQSAMQDMITAANQARSDVDSIAANSATTFSWGSLNGKAIQFDSTQLDAMDRIIAVYLTQQFISPGVSGGFRPGPHSAHKQSVSPRVSFSSMGNLLSCLASNESACFMQAQEAVQSSSNPTDTSTAWLSGTIATLSGGGAGQAAAFPALAQGFVQVSTAMDSLTHAISDSAFCNAAQDGCDATAQQSILSELNSAGAAIVSSISQTISQIPAMLGLELEAQTAKLADDGIQSVLKAAADESSGKLATADTTDVTLVSPANLLLLNGYLGYATGIADEGSGQTSSTPQNSLDLCCFGASGLGIVALADPDGYYDLLVPIGVEYTNYDALTLSEDSSSGSVLDSETVDLFDISSTATVTLQTLDPSPPPTGGSLAGTWTGSMTESIDGCGFAGTMSWVLTQSGTGLTGSYVYNGSLTSGPVDPCGATTTYSDTFAGSVSGNAISLSGAAAAEIIAATVSGSTITGTMTAEGGTWAYTLTKQ